MQHWATGDDYIMPDLAHDMRHDRMLQALRFRGSQGVLEWDANGMNVLLNLFCPQHIPTGG